MQALIKRNIKIKKQNKKKLSLQKYFCYNEKYSRREHITKDKFSARC